jgi:hypothetical protein
MPIPDSLKPIHRRQVLSLEERRELYARTDIEETVPTAEAAALLGNQPQTLRRWACQGDGPICPRRVNGRLRWSVGEIRRLLSGEAE